MRTKISNNQSGLISIIIVTVLIVVVTIITLTFASITNREQRAVLDQQLSIQARLAAEAVIDEKIAEFRSNPESIQDIDDCGTLEQTFDGVAEEIQTTCLVVDTTLGSLEYEEVDTNDSTIAWIDPAGVPINRIIVSWQRADSDNVCMGNNYGEFPQNLSLNPEMIGMIRFDLSRIGPAGGTFNRESLTSGSLGGVLQPKSGGTVISAIDYQALSNSSNQPVIFGGCGSPPAEIPDPYEAYGIINVPESADRYILRLRGIYRASQLKIVGLDASDNIVELADAQIGIEATARVNDIVQRIQVRVPASSPPANLLPDHAVHVTNGGLCKLLQTEPAGTSTVGC